MAKRNAAPVGVAMIAKNAAETLPRCIASFRSHVSQIVVAVDDATTDGTAKAARRAGADRVVPFTMLEDHACPHHGQVKAQHFGHARTFSWSLLDPALDFALWIDSDDVLEGAEHLPRLCANVPPDCAGCWMPYEYAWSQEKGVRRVNTLFHRERLLRTRIDGQPVEHVWTGRVHETVAPKVEAAKWIPDPAVAGVPGMKIVHQDGAHKTEVSATRNLLLLEIDYEDDPESERTIFYLGNTHFALGHWPDAVEWFGRLCHNGRNPYQKWQGAVYASKAAQNLGAFDVAEDFAWRAIREADQHPEPFICLAEIALKTGRDADVPKWVGVSRTKTPPPFYVFQNPLDVSFNTPALLGNALERLGRITEARHEYEAAYRAMPAPPIAEAIGNLQRTETAMRQAQGLADLLRGKPDDEVIRLFEAHDPPLEVRAFGRVRDVVMPCYLRRREREAA